MTKKDGAATVIPALSTLRATVFALEMIVAKNFWSIPDDTDILFNLCLREDCGQQKITRKIPPPHCIKIPAAGGAF